MSGPDSPVDADLRVKPLAIRILDAHFERTWAARQDYAAKLAERADLTRDDIFMDTLRRATDGVEPTWLRRAKQLHDEIGKCIYVVSQAPSPHLSTEVVMEAEKHVRAFVDAMPGQVSQDRTDAMAFLAVLAAVSARDPAVAEPLNAGQPPEEVVCFALSFHDVFLSIRVAMFVDDVAKVLTRWEDDSPPSTTNEVDPGRGSVEQRNRAQVGCRDTSPLRSAQEAGRAWTCDPFSESLLGLTPWSFMSHDHVCATTVRA